MGKQLKVPDIGDFDAVEVIEVLVKAGDTVANEQPLIALESDKATMEVPATAAGKLTEVTVKEGDHVAEGDVIAVLEESDAAEEQPAETDQDSDTADTDEAQASAERPSVEEDSQPPADSDQSERRETSSQAAAPAASDSSQLKPVDEKAFAKAHASPAVRKFARELGVDLGQIQGSGPKARILREDVQDYVKRAVGGGQQAAPAAGGDGLPQQPDMDFSPFGATETVALSRIGKLSARALHKSWLLIPHVTQFESADITELEAFRQDRKQAAAAQGVKLTLLAFLLKAAGAALRQFPKLNASLAADGEHLILKQYVNIGVAVDTEAGLVVPVIRGVDGKGIYELAGELGEVSARARDGKLKGDDMKGGCFTISSLGGIGGTAFTPIVNSPEVAILGVSRGAQQPVWNGSEFIPRLILPLSLSYDHRVIDGAQAAHITSYFAGVLGDLRRLLL